jgi:anthranilate phosphoribosyltransferase
MLSSHLIAECIEEAHIAFMYAPHFHPAMKYVVPIRKAMGIRCVFNVLGPLLNPAGCKRVVIGVYTPTLLDIFGQVFLSLGIEHGLVVHCAGLDELNSIGTAQVVEVTQAKGLQKYELDPKDIGIPRSTLEELKGGDATENAKILRSVFAGGDACENAIGNTIAYNAGAGLYVYGLASSIKEGYEIARKTLKEGKALAKMDQWASIATRLATPPSNPQ